MLSFKKERSPGNFRPVDINSITPNPHQPRAIFDEAALRSLCQSIREYGIINPLTVKETGGGKYQLISGERRLKAAKMAGLKSVPCHILPADSQKSALMALVENLERSDLGFFEEAVALKKLQTDFDMTQSDIAKMIGKTQSAVANKIRLLRLHPQTVEQIAAFDLTERHARALLRIEDECTQSAVAKYIGEKALNVEQSERHIENVLRNISKERRKNTKILLKDVRIFVNTVRKYADTLIQSGINADFSQVDEGDYTVISVKIKK